MYFTSSVSKPLVLVSILAVVAIQLLLIRSVSALNMTNAYLHHKCYVNQGKYKQGSTYEKHLTDIIDSIPLTTNFSTGYEMMSLGKGPNYVSVTHQCRGDSYGPKCRSYYSTALSQLRKRCPRYKGGIIWYDQCFLEISGIDSFRKVDYNSSFCMSNPKNVSGNQFLFDRQWNILLVNLTNIATEKKNGDPTKLYAAGEREFERKKLYGMVQCTQDLTRRGCEECMVHYLAHYADCMNGKRGARVLGKSCNFRFELYPFVNSKADPEYLKI